MFVLDSIKINLMDPGERKRVYATVNDQNTRAVEVELETNAGPWIIPNGVGCVICFTKPDAHRGAYFTMPDGTMAWSAVENRLTLLLAPQMLNCEGLVCLSAVLTDGEEQLGVFSFDIHVTHGADVMVEPSEDYFTYQELSQINTAFAGLYVKLTTDTTLQMQGYPADAGAVGTALAGKAPASHVDNMENPHSVTAKQTGALPLSGGTMTGNIKMGGKKISELPEPTSAIEPLTQAFMNRAMGYIRFATNTTFDIPSRSRAVIMFGLQLNQAKGYCICAAYVYGGVLKDLTVLYGNHTPSAEVVTDDDGAYYLRITCDTNYSYGWYITQPSDRSF